MRRRIAVLSCLIMLVFAINACGGSAASSGYVPLPVPSEYKGLSVDELQTKSKKSIQRYPSGQTEYDDLLANLDSYGGELVWYSGEVDQVHEGETPETYQIWVCGERNYGAAGGKACLGRVLMLHSLELGPEIKVEDIVQMAGTVMGLQKTSLKIQANGGWHYIEVLAPKVSVVNIKVVDN